MLPTSTSYIQYPLHSAPAPALSLPPLLAYAGSRLSRVGMARRRCCCLEAHRASEGGDGGTRSRDVASEAVAEGSRAKAEGTSGIHGMSAAEAGAALGRRFE